MKNPLKIIDDEILRQFSKITKKWEDGGDSKYKLGLGIILVSSPAIFVNNIMSPVCYWIYGSELAQNINGIFLGQHRTGIKEQNGKQIISERYIYFAENVNKIFRTPLFLGGSVLFVKGLINLYNGYFNNDSVLLSSGFDDLILGSNLLGTSSSNYIRNSDPKVLDKKSVFEKFGEKLKELLPQPEFQPVPIKNLETILSK